jgi:two-component system cell cycle response regulator DivK
MSKVILVVEDDPMNLKLLVDLLKFAGYTVLSASDGSEGIKYAKAHKPDLILMDIQMPVMGGIEATRILKAGNETKDIPVIALTALAMEEDKEKTQGVGFEGYITKPIRIKQFLADIAGYLSRAKKE